MSEKAPRNKYKKTTYGGHTVDWYTRAALMAVAEHLYGDPMCLTVYQGSYNAGGVTASAGTHDGGGAVDLSPADHVKKVHALRFIGCFAAWHRLTLPGVWEEHIHAELLGNKKASSGAKSQWWDFRHFRNGLADHAEDKTPHPNPMGTFNYKAWRKHYNRSLKKKDWFSMADKSDLQAVVNDGVKRVIDRMNEIAGNDKKRDQAEADAIDKMRENSARREKALKDALDALTQVAQGTSTAAQVESARQSVIDAIQAG